MKNYLFTLCQIAITTLFFFVLFYIRLLPRVSRDLWENMNNQQLALILITITLILINIFYLCKMLHYFKTRENSWFSNFSNKFKRVILFLLDCFLTTYNKIWFLLELITEKVFAYPYLHYNLIRIFLRRWNKENYWLIYAGILLTLRYLPKIIITVALFIDVIINKKLDYTFRCLPLLLVPLLEKFILFVFQDYYDTHSEIIYAYIQIDYLGPDTYEYSFIPEFQKDPPPIVKDFPDFYENHYLIFAFLKIMLLQYKEKSNLLHLDLLLAIIRLIIYIYILLYGL